MYFSIIGFLIHSLHINTLYKCLNFDATVRGKHAANNSVCFIRQWYWLECFRFSCNQLTAISTRMRVTHIDCKKVRVQHICSKTGLGQGRVPSFIGWHIKFWVCDFIVAGKSLVELAMNFPKCVNKTYTPLSLVSSFNCEN